MTVEGLTINGQDNPAIQADGIGLTLSRMQVVNSSTNVMVQPGSASAPTGAVVTVFDSTITGGVDTGAIFMDPYSGAPASTLSVVNSTLTGNTFESGGGGGISLVNTHAILRDDTITGNTGAVGALQIGTASSASVTNTVLAGNTSVQQPAWADCRLTLGSTLTDGGHNLIGVASPGAGNDCGFVNSTNGDQTGSTSTPLNPDLGPLAANGGTTQTIAPQPGSPTIGTGGPTDCQAWPVSGLDQRGDTRNAKSRGVCDVGAYDTGGA